MGDKDIIEGSGRICKIGLSRELNILKRIRPLTNKVVVNCPLGPHLDWWGSTRRAKFKNHRCLITARSGPFLTMDGKEKIPLPKARSLVDSVTRYGSSLLPKLGVVRRQRDGLSKR